MQKFMCSTLPMLLVVVTIAHLSQVRASVNDGSGERFCGQTLVSVVRFICNGHYKSTTEVMYGKRSGAGRAGPKKLVDPMQLLGESMDSNDDDDQLLVGSNRFTTGALFEPSSYAEQFRRGRRALFEVRHLADECCINPCNMDTMKSYCQ